MKTKILAKRLLKIAKELLNEEIASFRVIIEISDEPLDVSMPPHSIVASNQSIVDIDDAAERFNLFKNILKNHPEKIIFEKHRVHHHGKDRRLDQNAANPWKQFKISDSEAKEILKKLDFDRDYRGTYLDNPPLDWYITYQTIRTSPGGSSPILIKYRAEVNSQNQVTGEIIISFHPPRMPDPGRVVDEE